VLVARAVENFVPLVAADVAGWQGDRVCHGTTAIVDAQGTVVAAARSLEEDFIVADVALDGLSGGMDGRLLGDANPAVIRQFLALWGSDRTVSPGMTAQAKRESRGLRGGVHPTPVRSWRSDYLER
jgi:hypothetical protein